MPRQTVLSESEQIQCVRENWRQIWRFPNAPEEAQLAAVAVTTEALRLIRKPTEHVQLQAVSEYGWALEYLRAPSIAVQRAAVQQNGYVIRYVEDPDEDLQVLAVKQCPEAIQSIAAPCEAAQMVVALSQPTGIRLIHGPLVSVQEAAIRKYPWAAFQHIDNPSREICKDAIKHWGQNIRFVSEPDEEMQLLAALQSPTFLQAVPAPSPRIVEALKVLEAMDVRQDSNDFKTLLRDMIQPQTPQPAPTHA